MGRCCAAPRLWSHEGSGAERHPTGSPRQSLGSVRPPRVRVVDDRRLLRFEDAFEDAPRLLDAVHAREVRVGAGECVGKDPLVREGIRKVRSGSLIRDSQACIGLADSTTNEAGFRPLAWTHFHGPSAKR
jgi:hypothetical protein